MTRLLSVATVLMLSVAGAQIELDRLTRVADSDSAVPALKGWQQSVEVKYRQSGLVVPTVFAWFVLPSDSLKTLFPQHRFFVTAWSERPAPGTEKEAIGLAAVLKSTLACDAAGKIVKEVHHTGNYDAFGDLLNVAKVAIRNNDDAKLVWNAFCDIHGLRWQKQPAIKIDDKTWHLGDVTIGKFHYYYKVLLDTNLHVVSAKLHADEIKKP